MGLVLREAPQCVEAGNSPVYRQYIALAALHLVNAVQYLWLWRPWFADNARKHSWFFLFCVLAPELLNLLEAGLYLHTSLHYQAVQQTPRCVEGPDNPGWFACPELLRLHEQELYASLIELVASFLWFWSWTATAEHDLPGRGFTLWDLDLHSSYLLIVGSTIYTVRLHTECLPLLCSPPSFHPAGVQLPDHIQAAGVRQQRRVQGGGRHLLCGSFPVPGRLSARLRLLVLAPRALAPGHRGAAAGG